MKLTLDPPLDYDEVGLMCGLEVHQQLLTAKKLFCHCPAGLYTDTHDGTVLRHMRPTLSELGLYDGTALMEFKSKKNIIYLLHRDNTCTYEMDDTPPFLVNQDALDVAIEQCLMLGCDIIDEVHIARKQYLDGSIPTGFQRTAIVGVNGRIPFRGREISITQISVEEDSCREVSDSGHLIVWRTDRLGMPLIETVTGPDLRTPDEAAEAILLVGRVCRSTGHVRVGAGASRQDVNVSVRGGRRVEIKGVSYAWLAPRLVHGEAWRQVNLLSLRDMLHASGFESPDSIRVTPHDVTSVAASFGIPFLTRPHWEERVRNAGLHAVFEYGAGEYRVLALRVEGLAAALARPTQPGHTFIHELAGRVRVIAGLDEPPILLHDGNWCEHGGSRDHLRVVREEAGCKEGDGLLIVWGPAADCVTAVEEIRIRLVEALDGVPHETRQPLPDGSTDFERILPGPDRMYPDTDSPPTMVTRERVSRLKSSLPPPPWQREERYTAAGVPVDTIHYLIRRGGADLVDAVVQDSAAHLRRACFFFGEQLKGMRRRGIEVDRVGREQWREFFALVAREPLIWEARVAVVERLCAPTAGTQAAGLVVLETVVAELGVGRRPPDWKKRAVEAAGDGYRSSRRDSAERRLRYAVGRAMRELRGAVPAAEVLALFAAAAQGKEPASAEPRSGSRGRS